MSKSGCVEIDRWRENGTLVRQLAAADGPDRSPPRLVSTPGAPGYKVCVRLPGGREYSWKRQWVANCLRRHDCQMPSDFGPANMRSAGGSPRMLLTFPSAHGCRDARNILRQVGGSDAQYWTPPVLAPRPAAGCEHVSFASCWSRCLPSCSSAFRLACLRG